MNYAEIINEDIDRLLGQKELPELSRRIEQVEVITEWYYQSTGQYPHSYQLDRLGSYILAEDLRDKATHKVKKTEYPILSPTQTKLRNRRERRVGDDNLDFLKVKEVDNNPNAFRKRTQNMEV